VSLFTRGRHRRTSKIDGPPLFDGDIPSRSGGGRRGVVSVTSDSALRHSAVWACLRIRADLVSTFPCDVFRRIQGLRPAEVPKPPVLVDPGGERWDYQDWMYASQVDLDRAGNVLGLVTERDGMGKPSRIDLQALGDWTVRELRDSGELRYRVKGKDYTADQVWHERQYVVSGLPVGLSPIAYAAWSVSEYLSAQHFALSWFGGGGIPKARMKNTAKTIPSTEAAAIKLRFEETMDHGGLLVHGRDWEYDPLQSQQMGMEWLEGRKYGLADISRYLGCPADMIEAAVSAGGSVRYENITSRHLDFLIIHLGPAVSRREKNLTKLLPKPRFVKLNTDALLRMDPEKRAKMMDEAIKHRRMTVTEARELDNRAPLTAEQEAEFVRLFGTPRELPERDGARVAEPEGWERVSPFSAVPAPRPPTFDAVDAW
jgi:HK97 family phage portal protein